MFPNLLRFVKKIQPFGQKNQTKKNHTNQNDFDLWGNYAKKGVIIMFNLL